MMKRFWLINLITFQLSWFSAVFYPLHAPLMMALLLALHFLLSPSPKVDAKLLLLVPLGVCADKLQMHFGVFSGGDSFFPIFLVLLWCFFVISLHHSLQWVTSLNLPLQIGFGALGGASSYWAGIESGALQTSLTAPWLLAILMGVWAVLLPTLIYGYHRLTTPSSTQPIEHKY